MCSSFSGKRLQKLHKLSCLMLHLNKKSFVAKIRWSNLYWNQCNLVLLQLFAGILYSCDQFKWIGSNIAGLSGGAKVLCILHHWGVLLILAYSWARPAILVVGKGRGGMFLFLLFLHFLSCSSFFPVPLFHLLYSLFYLFSPFLWETTQNDPQGLTCR